MGGGWRVADQGVPCGQAVEVVGEAREGTCLHIVCHYTATSPLKPNKNEVRRQMSCVVLILLASATLLCLKGLKSSLTCTVTFLTTFVPKKGLGAGGLYRRIERRTITDAANSRIQLA